MSWGKAAGTLLAAVLIALAGASAALAAKDLPGGKPPPLPEVPAELTPAQADALLAGLTDAQARQLLAQQLKKEAERRAAAAEHHSGGLGMQLVRLRKALEGSGDDVGKRVAVVQEGGRALPGALAASLDKLGGGRRASGLAAQVGWLALILAVGAGVHWSVRRALAPRRVRAETRPDATFAMRLCGALLRAALELLPLAAFALVTIWLAQLAFAPGSTERSFHVAFLTGAFLILAVDLALRLVLAPDKPTLRLVHLGDAGAAFLHRWLLRVSAASILLWLATGLLVLAGMPRPAHLALVLVTGLAVATLLAAMVLRCRAALAAAMMARAAAEGGAWRASLAATWHLFALLYIGVVWLLWAGSMLDGRDSAVWAAIASIAVLLVYPLLDRWIGRGIDDLLSSGAPDSAQRRHDIAAVLHRVMRVLLVILLFAGIHELWDFEVFDAAGERIRRAVVIASLDLAAAILLAVLGWQLIKVGIDRRLAGREVDGVRVEPTQRERTLLPLARKFLVVVLVVMTVMLLLSALGVNIGPLLAGAGVVGLAVGFGAQTLVRDIITGVFLLLDDAFRVGEYIVSGSYKGTVEAIGIRALKLRHHRGPLYTVPFSELKGIQNQSRDWVIDKFNIGITYDSDIDKARKLIKKIGEQLAAEPDFAPHILEPLKMQGVETFGDFAIQVRVKMKTKPGEQFVIRRKANAMIKKAFDENGIRFAFPTVQVSGAEAAAVPEAVAAAARQVITPPAGTG